MKRLALITVIVAAAVAPASAQAAPVPSKVKITDAFVDMASINFAGKVKSPKARCKGPGRSVDLYRTAPGTDTYVESGLTEDNGRWVIDGPLVAGTYYVRIEKLFSLGGAKPCAGDKSGTREFN